MQCFITYDDTSKEFFEPQTRRILDRLAVSYPVVEIECRNHAEQDSRWFVQVAESKENIPVGYFGSTVAEAASRVASALKIEIPPE